MRGLIFLIILSIALSCPFDAIAKKKRHPKHPLKRPVATHKVVKRRHRTSPAPVVRSRASAPPVQSRAVSAPIYSSSQLGSRINAILAAKKMDAVMGVYVKSMQTGQLLYAKNIDRSFVPASTLKIMTAEAALVFLGPDYRFSTQLLTDATKIKGGVLKGNLYVVLNGDPSLTYANLVNLFETLRSYQINAISGNVYVDDTAYDQRFYGPGWIEKDKRYCFAAPISASIINHNCLAFRITPARSAGYLAQINPLPQYFYPPMHNTIVTKSGSARGCSVRVNPIDGSSLSLEGCMARGHAAIGVSQVITDVQDYNLLLFSQLLKNLSIRVQGRVTLGKAPRYGSLMGQYHSDSLRELVREMLKKSDNVIAGALFKKVGQIYSRQAGSWENGRNATVQILAKNAHFSSAGGRILDGSGLSPDNTATPSQMMQVLDFAYHNSRISDAFISALPIAGVDGTLKHRLGQTGRRIRAKTGTISGVVSLAGYAISADKEPLAFVIMVNGRKGMGWEYRAIEDQIALALIRYRRA